ncbi:MAG: hypothetical protein V1850_00210 [Candidatus Bathyarchaeota archaeon]
MSETNGTELSICHTKGKRCVGSAWPAKIAIGEASVTKNGKKPDTPLKTTKSLVRSYGQPAIHDEITSDIGKKPDNDMSLIELKRIAASLLPRDSLLRSIILSEPDSIPRPEGLAKLEIFVKILNKEPER